MADFSDTDNPNNNLYRMQFGRHHKPAWAVFLALGGIAAVLFVVIGFLGTMNPVVPPQSPVTVLHKSLKKPVIQKKHGATDNLIGRLKQYGMWGVSPSREVPRFFIESYPADLNAVADVSIRKKVFLNALLPHALLVRQEVLQKRNRLESILEQIACPVKDINFAAGLEFNTLCSWSDYLTRDEISFIETLSTQYRTTTAQRLLERVDAIPASIILAQGALESSWGTSRFTREGNSIFGMWTWKTKGMVPSRRDAGKTHKVKVYEKVLDAVRAYHLTLNRLDFYEQFRQLRLQTDDPLILADGLTLYSERGEAYVEDIKKVIQTNNLQKYDVYNLSDMDLSEFSDPQTGANPVTESAEASL